MENGEEHNYFKYCMLVIVVGIIIVGVFLLENLCTFSNVFMERKIFETSYQLKASLKSEIAVHEAALAEINVRLANKNLTESARNNLEAQAASLRLQIRAAKEQL